MILPSLACSVKAGRHIGVECKRADATSLTPSMRIALADLKLHHIHVIYPGNKTYSLARNIESSRWRHSSKHSN